MSKLRRTSNLEIPSRFIYKVKFVSKIFTNVEHEYDVLLRLMTLGFDWVWRRRMYSKITYANRSSILDLACGTGLVTFELHHSVVPAGFVVGLDLSPSMLRVAQHKKHQLGIRNGVEFVRAVGEFLPFRDRTFRFVTVGLALRNFGDKLSVFREALRVMVPLGCFLSVDFVRPENFIVRRLYKFHIFHVLPALGRLVSSYWCRTLVYLANSIQIASSGQEVCRMMREVGFRQTFEERMTLGVVVLVGGRKGALG